MKLIAREKGQFELDGNFRQHPQKPEDVIKLKILKTDFKFMIEHLDWRQLPNLQLDTLFQFLECARQSKNRHIKVPYVIGLQSIKALLNIAINQYELMEEKLELL